MSDIKVMVITGGTRGIGKSIVTRFLQNGFRVFTCGSSLASAMALEEEFQTYVSQGLLLVEEVNVASKEALRAWTERIVRQNPSVDVLVNNAGIFLPGSIATEEDGTFETLIQTNLASAYHTSRFLLPALLKSPQAHIFSICSTASITAYPNGGSYGISKFGLLGMNKTLREELKSIRIRVTSVLPGATFTDSWSSSGLPEDRFMKAEDVADAVWSAWKLSPSCVVEEILLRPLEGDIP